MITNLLLNDYTNKTVFIYKIFLYQYQTSKLTILCSIW